MGNEWTDERSSCICVIVSSWPAVLALPVMLTAVKEYYFEIRQQRLFLSLVPLHRERSFMLWSVVDGWVVL